MIGSVTLRQGLVKKTILRFLSSITCNTSVELMISLDEKNKTNQKQTVRAIISQKCSVCLPLMNDSPNKQTVPKKSLVLIELI